MLLFGGLTSPFAKVTGTKSAKSVVTRLPEEALVGYGVRDIKTGALLAQRNATQNFTPGSIVKLVTAQMALEALGPKKVFVTRLLHNGQVRKNVLEGDLIVRGDGDPTFGSREFGPAFQPGACFAAWADSLKKHGIATVTGGILPDASALSNLGPDPSQLWEDVGNYYASLATGLAFMDNAYAIRFQGNPRPGEPFVLLGTEPLATGIDRFEDHLTAGPTQGKDSAYIFGTPPFPLRILRGTYPAGHWEFRIRGALPDPGWTFTREFKKYLEGTGIRIQEPQPPLPCMPPAAQRLGLPREPVAGWTSPPLMDMLRRMLVFSDNHIAAHLFAQSAKAMGQGGSREGGLKALQVLLAKEGWDGSQMILYDGNGLSPLDRVSPAQFTLWLQRAARNENTFPQLLDAMSGAAGSEEKLVRYGATLRGKLWAKTGTLEGVAALAGFMKTRTGRWVSFTIMANHFSGSAAEVQKAFAPLLQVWQQL